MGGAHYLPQSPLPEVPGRRGTALARRPRGRAPAGSLLSRRLHPAGGDRRDRVPEQGRRLRPPVPDRRGDADHHRRRPEASGRAHRPDRHTPHLGLGADPSPARPRHRSRRRPVAGRIALDRLQARLLPARARAVASLPPALPRRARSPACSRPPRLPQRPRAARRQASLRSRARAAAPLGMPSRWGCCHPHPSQTRTCGIPASGSSRERFARGGVSVEDLGWRQRMAFQDFVEARPSDDALAISPRQPLLPYPHDLT